MKLNRSGRSRVHLAATLLLMMAVIGFYIYVNFSSPASFYSIKYDPEYAYFMNSLLVYKSEPYVYVDHPGTPIELLGSGLLALTYFIAQHPSLTFVQFHIQNPQVFLMFARGFLTLAGILVLFLLARHAVERKNPSDLLVSLGVAASFFAVHPPFAFTSLVFWAHNSFAFPFGTLLLLILLTRLRNPLGLRWWEIAGFGFAAGLLAAIQLWFTTWVFGVGAILTLFAYLRRRSWGRALGSAALAGFGALAGFVSGTLPVVHKYIWLAYWVETLLFHTGRYGNGPAGFTTPQQLIKNFVSLFGQAPVVLIAAIVVLVIAVIAVIYRRKALRDDPVHASVVIGLTLQLALLLFIVLKHPGRYYLLGAAAIIPVLLAGSYGLASRNNERVTRTAARIGVLLLVGFFVSLFLSVRDHHWRMTNIKLAEAELSKLKLEQADALGKKPEDLRIHWGYGTRSPCFALHFGNKWAGRAFNEEVFEICSRDVVYNVWASDEKLQTYGPWDIIVVPENYLAQDSDRHGRVVFSEAKTEKYGRIVFILASP
jgi:hypothetical protein